MDSWWMKGGFTEGEMKILENYTEDFQTKSHEAILHPRFFFKYC